MATVSLRRRTFLSLVTALPFVAKPSSSPAPAASQSAPSNHVLFGAPRLDGVTLLGMSEQEALQRILAPVRMSAFESGHSAYMCGDPHIRVIEFQAGRLVEYQVAPRCGARTIRGIGAGDPLQRVVERYGALHCPQGRTRFPPRSSNARGAVVVDARRHASAHERMWASYPHDGVVFQLGHDRRVRTIAVKARSAWVSQAS